MIKQKSALLKRTAAATALGALILSAAVACQKDEKKEELGAITHKDGTCRIQTVNNKINERVTTLLNKFNEVSGIPAVLNTSFNDNGEPIVESPQDAIRSFLNMDIDYLVIGNYVVKK